MQCRENKEKKREQNKASSLKDGVGEKAREIMVHL